MGLQYPPRLLRQLRRPPAPARVYESRHGRVQGEGEGDADREDDQARGESAGGVGLVGIGGVVGTGAVGREWRGGKEGGSLCSKGEWMAVA